MSCGKTPTRRQVKTAKRSSAVKKHVTKAVAKKTTPARQIPAGLAAWEKAHPFKNNFAAWKKAHPLTFTPFTAVQWAAWKKAHPFTAPTAKRVAKKSAKHAVTSKVHCQVKTRHAVSATRHQKPKPKKKATGPTFNLRNKPAPAVRAAKSSRAAKSARARRAR